MNLTPWIAGSATMALCVGFSMPIGRERAYRTTYASFAGLRSSFFRPASAPRGQENQVAGAGLVIAPASGDANHAAAPAGGAAPAHAAAYLAESHARGARKRGKRPTPTVPAVAVSTPSAVPRPDQTPILSASPLDGVPLPAPKPAAAPADDSPEALRDAFDADPSKFPLDAKVSAEGITLRLVGLCRMKSGYLVKATVANGGSADFFVQELAAYSGGQMISVRTHIRLFVEPGRSRDGYVVVAPAPGAQVKLKLKEDGERGRVLEVPLRYPF